MTTFASDIEPLAGLDTATVFAATTRHGTLHLALDGDTSSPARAAARLAAVEPLLQWLEDWLGEALDPAPADHLEDVPAVRLHWQARGVAAAVDVPWPALLACRPAPELAGFWRDAVRWEPLELELLLAHESLDDDEWQALQQPGAGWLLRASFAADGRWPCELRLASDGAASGWSAHWEPALRRLAWDALPAPLQHDAGAAQALLATPLRMTPPELLGWHAETACHCPQAQPVTLRPAARHGQRALRGQLLPVGLRASGAEATLASTPLRAGWVLRVEGDASSLLS